MTFALIQYLDATPDEQSIKMHMRYFQITE